MPELLTQGIVRAWKVSGNWLERCPASFRNAVRLQVGIPVRLPPESATARKMAVLFYKALRHGMDYVDPGVSYYGERYRKRKRCPAPTFSAVS